MMQGKISATQVAASMPPGVMMLISLLADAAPKQIRQQLDFVKTDHFFPMMIKKKIRIPEFSAISVRFQIQINRFWNPLHQITS